eukprot:Opistho-2@37523
MGDVDVDPCGGVSDTKALPAVSRHHHVTDAQLAHDPSILATRHVRPRDDDSGDHDGMDKAPAKVPRVDPAIVQITASKAEIDKRISAFVERKQLEKDKSNRVEFCRPPGVDGITCARLDAIMHRLLGRRTGHMKVSYVRNTHGPSMPQPPQPNPTVQHLQQQQQQPRMPHYGPSGAGASSTRASVGTAVASMDGGRAQSAPLPTSVAERFINLESHLGIGVGLPPDVYQRLRRLEDRMLELESCSPELFMHNMVQTQQPTTLPHHQQQHEQQQQQQQWTMSRGQPSLDAGQSPPPPQPPPKTSKVVMSAVPAMPTMRIMVSRCMLRSTCNLIDAPAALRTRTCVRVCVCVYVRV